MGLNQFPFGIHHAFYSCGLLQRHVEALLACTKTCVSRRLGLLYIRTLNRFGMSAKACASSNCATRTPSINIHRYCFCSDHVARSGNFANITPLNGLKQQQLSNIDQLIDIDRLLLTYERYLASRKTQSCWFACFKWRKG